MPRHSIHRTLVLATAYGTAAEGLVHHLKTGTHALGSVIGARVTKAG